MAKCSKCGENRAIGKKNGPGAMAGQCLDCAKRAITAGQCPICETDLAVGSHIDCAAVPEAPSSDTEPVPASV